MAFVLDISTVYLTGAISEIDGFYFVFCIFTVRSMQKEMCLCNVLVFVLRKYVLRLFRSEASSLKLLLRKPSHVEPDFFSFNIFVCITTVVEADQCKTFM